jgi:hypothetical protein
MTTGASAEGESRKSPYGRQMVASLLVALLIVVVTIALVTSRLGANGGVDSEDGGRERGNDNSGKGSDNGGHSIHGMEVRLAQGAVRLQLGTGRS